MTEMIERVAMAMREQLGVEWPYAGHEYLVDVAKAAIAAMRTPTKAMLDNVDHDPGFCDEPGEATPDVEIWKSMIDAALGDDT